MPSANTLTGLISTIYKAADTVAREQVGLIPAVYINADVDQVAKDQVITYPIVGAQTATDVTPAYIGPDANGQTPTTGTMTINKVKSVKFPWNGDEQAAIRPLYKTVIESQFEQAMRTLVNEIEADLALAAERGASRAAGAAGTTPFATAANFQDFADVIKIMKDNGAPMTDCHMILNTTASANIRAKQSSLFKANEAGSDDMLRNGSLGRVEGLMLHESAAIVTHVKGTGSLYVFNGAHAIGATTVVAKTGTGTVLTGDIVAFEDDARKYVVNTGIAAPGSMVIGGPGLRQAQVDLKTITIGPNYLGNFAFHRNAIHLLTRLPLMPDGGDSADDVVTITDPYSGLSFQVALYRQYRQVVYEVAIAWGVKAVKSDFIVTLLG